MRTQKRLEKISTTISLFGLALGFSALGLGAAFLIAACLHWKSGGQIQSGFRVEEVPAAEIVSEMRQAAEAICSF
jgi:hypothetical protein